MLHPSVIMNCSVCRDAPYTISKCVNQGPDTSSVYRVPEAIRFWIKSSELEVRRKGCLRRHLRQEHRGWNLVLDDRKVGSE